MKQTIPIEVTEADRAVATALVNAPPDRDVTTCCIVYQALRRQGVELSSCGYATVMLNFLKVGLLSPELEEITNKRVDEWPSIKLPVYGSVTLQ